MKRKSLRCLGRVSSNSQGFTLIEVLIAMAITAVIGVIAYAAVDTAIAASESSATQLAKLNEINSFFSRLERDIRQAVARDVRDAFGEKEAALWGGIAEEKVLNLTRSGWQNFSSAHRSRLQRVSYIWREDGLWRQSWKVLDRTSDNEPVEYLLLSDIEDLQIRFLELSVPSSPGAQPKSEWRDEWDSENTSSTVEKMPIAIELTVEVEGVGVLKRMVEVVAYE